MKDLDNAYRLWKDGYIKSEDLFNLLKEEYGYPDINTKPPDGEEAAKKLEQLLDLL